MLTIPMGGPSQRLCTGTTRRTMLRLGATGLVGGLTLPQILAASDSATTGRVARAKSCIFLFLEGGPPHQDMWDPKPDAPSEIRGPFKTISTSLPGVFFAEHCVKCAPLAHKFALVRSHSHADNGHATGYHYVMTGRKAAFPDGEYPIPTNNLYPSLGSVIARELGVGGGVPPYINMPHPMSAGGPGFLGAEHAPFVIEADPSQPDFEIKDLGRIPGIADSRFDRRRKFLSKLERTPQSIGPAGSMSTYYRKAYDLITSAEARKAFDIRSEPASLREKYGLTQVGQCALLGRRLVEAGCRFVGIDAPGWDVHFNCFPSLKGDLIPPADMAFAALITDLEERGLLDSTLVVMMGEMGRTPRINAQAGRDHWSMAQSILFAGAGIKVGQVIGETDKQAAAPTKDPVSISDLLVTLYTLMGIDPGHEYQDPLGRPVPIVDQGKVIPGLLA